MAIGPRFSPWVPEFETRYHKWLVVGELKVTSWISWWSWWIIPIPWPALRLVKKSKTHFWHCSFRVDPDEDRCVWLEGRSRWQSHNGTFSPHKCGRNVVLSQQYGASCKFFKILCFNCIICIVCIHVKFFRLFNNNSPASSVGRAWDS